MRGGLLPELKVTITDEYNAIINNHSQPISVVLEILKMSIYAETPTITIDVNSYARVTYVDSIGALKVNKSGGVMTGPLMMGSNKITYVAEPTNTQNASTKTTLIPLLTKE